MSKPERVALADLRAGRINAGTEGWEFAEYRHGLGIRKAVFARFEFSDWVFIAWSDQLEPTQRAVYLPHVAPRAKTVPAAQFDSLR